MLSRRFRIAAAAICVTAGAMLAATAAFAAFPGANGKIAFTHHPNVSGSSSDIFSIDPNGANRTQLTNTGDDDHDPSYSADGERIAFSRYPAGGPGGQIWVMNANGTGPVQLTPGTATAEDFGPTFSPDGGKILFARSDGSSTQLWIMNADGSGQTQLTVEGPNGDHVHPGSFSPNGAKIVFTLFDGLAGTHSIATINPDGSGLQRLTSGPDDFDPDFSPNGLRIIFDRDDAVTVMNADGTGVVRLATPLSGGGDFGPAFSPQGTQYVFERDDSSFAFSNLVIGDASGLDVGLTPITANTTAYDYAATWQPLNPPACNVGSNLKVKRYGSVTITATCANENATLYAEGTGKAKRVGRAVARKAKRFKIPPVSALIPAGAPTPVTLKIPKGARKALKKAAKAGKKGKATITASLVDDLGQATTDTVKVTFKAKRKRR